MPIPKPTKIVQVRNLMERPSGATLDAICKATGWQTHSARAMISGLRKAGHTVEREPGDADKRSIYRIVITAEADA